MGNQNESNLLVLLFPNESCNIFYHDKGKRKKKKKREGKWTLGIKSKYILWDNQQTTI